MRNIILCADDYGFNTPVSKGILDLVNQKRLSAVSCMTNFSDWTQQAQSIKPYYNKIDLGLHFNLTDGQALTNQEKFSSLPNLIKQAYTKQLTKVQIMKEFELQLAAFINDIGAHPNFIDGHQHIQQLPIIREAIIDVYLHHFPNKDVYFRVSSNGFFKSLFSFYNMPKPLLIYLLGARSFQKQLEQLTIPHNQSFTGIYNFARAHNYRKYFANFIQQIANKGLIMCHPGLTATDNSDPISQSRIHEYNYLCSDAFQNDCDKYELCLSRFFD